jgi:hypothetical protein
MSNLVKQEDFDQDYKTLKAMAGTALQSGKYGPEYNEATVLNIFMTAKALNVDPMLALNGGFNIIKGKINMGAHFMAGLIRRQGHSIQVVELSATKCVIIAKRKDNNDSLKYEMTIQEAECARLTGKDNWKSNPKQMLYCAAVRNVARILFSDIVGVAYDEDEMHAPLSATVAQPEFVEETLVEQVQPTDSLSEEQVAKLDFLVQQVNNDELIIKIRALIGVETIYDITPKDYDRVIKRLERELKTSEVADESAAMA